MKTRALALTLSLATCVGIACAAPQACEIETFRGAASPQGAVARVTVINTGSCKIANYVRPQERAGAAESGAITRVPANGTARFEAPYAVYVPRRGYVGRDEFEYEAVAPGAKGETRLKVLVKVTVLSP